MRVRRLLHVKNCDAFTAQITLHNSMIDNLLTEHYLFFFPFAVNYRPSGYDPICQAVNDFERRTHANRVLNVSASLMQKG